MNAANDDLPPPARLAIAYAPQRARAALALLLRFDARFAGIIANTSEPLITQMKIAWWRDAMIASVAARPKGEPLLSSLFELDDPAVNQAATQLANAWELLVGEDPWSAATLGNFARMRGQAIFDAYATLSGQQKMPSGLGEQWAADDLRQRFGERVQKISRPNPTLPNDRVFRPLTILAMSVRDVSGPRLIWHALTGR
jgi:15-cis-phytoene synthase